MKLQDLGNRADAAGAEREIHDAEVEMDAFGFAPHWASAIGGLGGTEASPDPCYAFRSIALGASPGRISFELQFGGLSGTKGTLLVEIAAISSFPGSMPIPVRSETVPVADLVAAGGVFRVEGVSRRNMLYTVMGNIYDETDVAASGLKVVAQFRKEEPPSNVGLGARLGIAKKGVPSSHQPATIGTVVRLLSLEQPDFSQPVSQGWTLRQCKEPAFTEWAAAMGREIQPTRANWEGGFIMQTLRCYGALRKGAMGLGFNAAASDALPSLMAAHGCSVLATARHDEALPDGDPGLALEHFYKPNICSNAEFFEQVHFTTVKAAGIPAELTNFDFAWSVRISDHVDSAAEFRSFVESAMLCLRPGGLAVHIFRQASETAPLKGGGVALDRSDIERLTLSLIALGHEVAQLRFGYGDRESLKGHVEIPFGLIARRSKN